MRPVLPAYGRALKERRSAQNDPWLVVVAVGALSYRDHFFRGDAGVAHLGVPEDALVSSLQWSILVGLDVLVAVDAATPRERTRLVLNGIWAGLPATFWQVHGEEHATRLHPFQAPQGRLEFVAWRPQWVALDGKFRGVLALERQWALEMAMPPLYSMQEFDELRRQAA